MAARAGIVGQQLENIGFLEIDVGDAVGRRVGVRRDQRRRRTVGGFHALALARHVQGEAAGGGEAIERLPAPRVLCGRAVVVTLIQKDACLLPLDEVGPQGECVHLHDHRLGNFAGKRAALERQLLFRPHGNIVARHDALGMKDLFQAGRDHALGGVHALIESLHHQVIAVAVHHQCGQLVGFAVHHAIGIGMPYHGAPVRLGGAQAVQKEIAADVFHLPRQHTQTDL